MPVGRPHHQRGGPRRLGYVRHLGRARRGHDAGACLAWKSGKESAFWRTAKGKDAGGYWPPKLAALVHETLPDAQFASITDTTPEKLQELSQAGYVLCGTMNTGQLYNNAYIHHDVNV